MKPQRRELTKRICFIGLVATLGMVRAARAQDRETFEVASIKVSQGDTSVLVQTDTGIKRPAYKPFRYTPGRVTCTLPLISIIAHAYGLKIWQVSGPAWLYDGAYEFAATMPVDTTREHARSMLRSLLADRFEMKSHNEMRNTTVFELTRGKGPVRLIESAETDSPELINNASDMKARKLTVQGLADWLNDRVDRPVIDHTGLMGSYNIELRWTPEYTDTNVKSTDFGLLRTMETELGLKLTAINSSQPILVIDHASKTPQEN